MDEWSDLGYLLMHDQSGPLFTRPQRRSKSDRPNACPVGSNELERSTHDVS